MKTQKRKHDNDFLGYGDEYYTKLMQQSMVNIPVLTHSIPHSYESKPKSVADLQNETWYYIKAKHTCNGMFLLDGCGGPYIELNDNRVRNCVYTPQEIFTTEQEAKAKLIEELTTHNPAENWQQAIIPITTGTKLNS